MPANIEELAEKCAEYLEEFIQVEKMIIVQEHELLSKLTAWDNVILHIDERLIELSKENTGIIQGEARKLVDDVCRELIRIRQFVEQCRLRDLFFVKEEDRRVKNLERLENTGSLDSVESYEWRAAIQNIDQDTHDIIEMKYVTEKELEGLHMLFKELSKMISKKRLDKAFEKDKKILTERQREEYENVLGSYFEEILVFIKSYENIFKDLWEKEKKISKHLIESEVKN
ncbi:hypothetical protein H6503_04570 [Candidatus Woesearchaeota archaeon]|nr:hypothetical protein [Candidatus Woesearchaeota archaeon]